MSNSIEKFKVKILHMESLIFTYVKGLAKGMEGQRRWLAVLSRMTDWTTESGLHCTFVLKASANKNSILGF